MNKNIGREIAIGGLMTSLAIIFTYIESLLPLSLGIPGIKLGLANVVVLFVLYNMGGKTALTINIIRVMLVGFMFGNMTSIIFSVSGALCSYLIMYLVFKHTKRNIIVVSTCGALAHIFGQLIAGMIWYPIHVLLYYCLFLLTMAFITGILIGIVVGKINYVYKTKSDY